MHNALYIDGSCASMLCCSWLSRSECLDPTTWLPVSSFGFIRSDRPALRLPSPLILSVPCLWLEIELHLVRSLNLFFLFVSFSQAFIQRKYLRGLLRSLVASISMWHHIFHNSRNMHIVFSWNMHLYACDDESIYSKNVRLSQSRKKRKNAEIDWTRQVSYRDSWVSSLKHLFISYPYLNRLIYHHISRIARIFGEIMSAVLFYQLVLCAVVAAINLFIIHLNEQFNMATVVAALAIETVFVPTFFYCYLSERITSALYEISDNFYDLAWYEMPIMQQKLITLPILHAQHGVRLTGLGIVNCSLQTFLEVKEKLLSPSALSVLLFKSNFHFHRLSDPAILFIWWCQASNRRIQSKKTSKTY